MLTISKKTFIQGRQQPHIQCEPPPTQALALNLKDSDAIEQIRFGLDYVRDNADIFIDMKSFCAGSIVYPADSVWITINLPNDKHIDWIIKKNEISLEYFIDGYGFTNYLFQNIYHGKINHSYIPKKYLINDDQAIWIYGSNSSGQIAQSMIVTEQTQIFKDIWSKANQILSSIDNLNIKKKSDCKILYESINLNPIFNELLDMVINYNLREQPIFAQIHQLQCLIHKVPDMFGVVKLWDQKNIPKKPDTSIPNLNNNSANNNYNYKVIFN